MNTFLLNILLVVLMLIQVDPNSLDKANQNNCQRNGIWTFGISGITEDTAPLGVDVKWENGSEEFVSLTRVTGQFAFYETRLHLDSLVSGASAGIQETILESAWTGKFNLLCDKPTGIELTEFTAQSRNTQISYLRLGGILVFLAIILAIFFRGKKR